MRLGAERKARAAGGALTCKPLLGRNQSCRHEPVGVSPSGQFHEESRAAIVSLTQSRNPHRGRDAVIREAPNYVGAEDEIVRAAAVQDGERLARREFIRELGREVRRGARSLDHPASRECKVRDQPQ